LILFCLSNVFFKEELGMERRKFIQTTGLSIASVLVYSTFSENFGINSHLIQFPDAVNAIINNENVKLIGKNERWSNNGLEVNLINSARSMNVEISAPKIVLSAVTLSWKLPINSLSIIKNDHWERTYGDVSWHTPNANEILPWYFMEYNRKTTNGFGVKTGAKSFCFWNVTEKTLSLTLDTKSGGNGVALGDRKLLAAQIVTLKGKKNESPFETTRRFTKLMCDAPRLPKKPIYGINDWYFSYGDTSEKLILDHTALMSPMTEGLTNLPFSVIDAGWFKGPPTAPNDCCWGDDMKTPDKNFPDMARLSEKIRKFNMRPALWTRPLCGSYKDSKSLMLPDIKGKEPNKPVLDPTIPENLERVKSYFKLYNQWGYDMVKFDFTTYDIFGKWGFQMFRDGAITESNWRMRDNSKTNAEIVLQLYKTIREAAGDMYVLGFNTFSHLSAGLFEINRIGDDTSGQEWERTLKMGVNTLAFRGATHNTFYAADGDCVGLTNKVDWQKNKQWLELLSKSGTPLFISAQADATGAAQKIAIKDAFALASTPLPVGEPLDWLENAFPKKWKLNGNVENFSW